MSTLNNNNIKFNINTYIFSKKLLNHNVKFTKFILNFPFFCALLLESSSVFPSYFTALALKMKASSFSNFPPAGGARQEGNLIILKNYPNNYLQNLIQNKNGFFINTKIITFLKFLNGDCFLNIYFTS